MPVDTGFVNVYNDFKGFGFIRRDKGKDVYFSIDDFKIDTDVESILVGIKLTFEVSKTAKGPRAENIEILNT